MSTRAVEVYDDILAEWELLEEFSEAREVETADGRTRIQLLRDGDATVDAGEVDGEEASVTFTYFVESPDSPGDTNRYTFGPAEAVVDTWAVDEDSRGSEASEFAGTADVFVAGVNV